MAASAKALGIVEQTGANWVKADKSGQLRGLNSEQLSAEYSGKSHGVLLEGAAMKYAWIEKNKLLWPVCVQ